MNEYIKSIRGLVRGEKSELNMEKMFTDHKCFYLLSLIKDEKMCTNCYGHERFLNSMNVKERITTCAGLFERLEAERVSYAVIKGAVLSLGAYGDPYIRRSSDIDLLIRRSDVDTVKRVMLEDGFIQGKVTVDGIKPFSRKELLFYSAMSHQTAPFVKKTANRLCPYVNTDVNMDIMWGESKIKADMDFVLAHTEKTSICGVTLNKLIPEMEFISLCLHHYKDMNSIYLLYTKGLRLSLFCDIYYYLANNHVDTDKLCDFCKRLGVSEYVYYCLYYTNLVFGDDSTSELCKKLENERGTELLNSFGLDEDEKYEWETSFYDRLFATDLQVYLKNHLSEKHLEKIKLNRMYM